MWPHIVMQKFVSILEEIMIYILESGDTKFLRIEVNFSERLQDFASQKTLIFMIVTVRLV